MTLSHTACGALAMVRFLAKTVDVNEIAPGYIFITFTSENEEDKEEFLEALRNDSLQALSLQRSFQSSQFKNAHGMNGVYIERNYDQSQGGYRGISQVVLQPGQVRVIVTDEMAGILGDREFEIALSLGSEEFQRLQAGLRRLFDGSSALVENI